MDYAGALNQAGFTDKEVAEAVEAKRAEYAGLLTAEDALKLVAAEHGIEEAKRERDSWAPLAALREGINASIKARVEKVSCPREFEKGGFKGIVVNLTVSQGDGRAALVLWNSDARPALEGKIRRGAKIAVRNAMVKRGQDGLELHSKFLTRVEVEGIDEPAAKKLWELKEGDNDVVASGIIIKAGELREFERNGRKGSVCNLLLGGGNEGAAYKLACWDWNATAAARLHAGDRVRVEGGYYRNGELNAGRESIIFKESSEPERLPRTSIAKIAEGAQAVVEAKITALYKAGEYEKAGRRGVFLSGELEDASGKARFAAFDDAVHEFLGAPESSVPFETLLDLKRGYLVGKTAVLVVRGKKNELNGETELVAEHAVLFKD
ncbi:hypothetical protein COX86_03315 [Candidatus Micrarchaeota archaeon CG_4_10_14_0_2_um_filter_60_11]|nr:MAG: hypothetical protein COU39_04195 [Candidatus Micrarchaeota archaeon CG10_big_fil_rev_8_21_14_0_10_60_32]PIO01758.1 MAG: hypothetical protein COT58_03285 [Candidatus Micrarchaeota archaeon CG09_land_8_20_14_0_10_60_16]PIY91125.1 MAG: hypothetical protein COY71_04835 [Candidatus Micrarchaeota archaeon CG_4_10_14_0_8_um_filter_60_7]PIZ90761.1 MAG: hypothetical protein COX86_03315 [Candidatus Micrarchaeota archaeon CG_4_10_14_0_2_um_filter_60_11]